MPGNAAAPSLSPTRMSCRYIAERKLMTQHQRPLATIPAVGRRRIIAGGKRSSSACGGIGEEVREVEDLHARLVEDAHRRGAGAGAEPGVQIERHGESVAQIVAH